MKTIFQIFALGILLSSSLYAQQAKDAAVMLRASVSENPARITIQWPLDTVGTGYRVFRKSVQGDQWGTARASLPASATFFVDSTASIHQAYEYYVQRTYSVSTQLAHGYIMSGIQVYATSPMGVYLIVMNQADVSILGDKLTRMENDLRCEGWKVRREVLGANATVAEVKQLIMSYATNSSAQLEAVLLLGHVPVPYSGGFKAENGNIYPPDGHPDHGGAWPADMYYGSFDESIWTDNLVNDTTPARVQNRNIPGDGKFDLMYVGDQKIAIQIGRIDVSNMPMMGLSDSAMLVNYLDKLHEYKIGEKQVVDKGLIDDNWGYMSGEAFSAVAWRDFSTMFGDSIETTDYLTSTKEQCYKFTWGGGAGSYTSAGGIGNTASFTNDSIQQIFTVLFGSYFGDWDAENSFLRAPLASRSGGLTSVWSGRPHWHFHHMALGQTIGYSTQLTQNNYYENGAQPFGYVYNSSPTFVHVALMGDPSLRLHMRKGVQNFKASVTSDSMQSILTWTKASDATGYVVFRASSLDAGINPLVQLGANDSSYTDLAPFGGFCKYVVRPIYLQQTPSGSYYNLGMGVMDSVFTKGVTGINESVVSFNCSLYPNPTQGAVTVMMDGNGADVEVFDITGKLILSIPQMQSTQTFDLGVYGKGYYVVKLKSEQGTAVRKLIVN